MINFSLRNLAITLGTAWLCAASAAYAERHALVIGNDAYQHSRKLDNPVNDATDLAKSLQGAGFQVTPLANGTHESMEKAVKSFANKLTPADTALFFFAGHGMQIKGLTYLIPVDAEADSPESLKYEAMSLDFVLDLLHRSGQGAGLKIVILDSCRDNPFGRSWRGSRTSASPNAGVVAPKTTPKGTILCFATDPSDVAEDGRDRNSPYTAALKRHLFVPGLDFDLALRKVGQAVQKTTSEKQNPWRNSNYNGSFAMLPGKGPPVFDAPTPSVQDTNQGSRAGEEREFAGMTFVWCPPGRFTMGSPANEQDRNDNEDQVEVTLSEGYWLGKYEVTQREWERVMKSNPSHFNRAKLPVEQVSWEEAQEFCGKLSAPLGWEARLPSEAQWEYACRAGSEDVRYGELDDVAWYDGNSGSKTHVVGGKRANAWGLHDMLGNVFEWTGDWYGGELSGGRDPSGPTTGESRVIRGGGWFSIVWYCRAADRSIIPPGDRGGSLGFRVCLSPAQKTAPSPQVQETPRVQEKPRVKDVIRGSRAGEEREYGGMRFVWCPPGRFTMGSPASEQDRNDNEKQVEVKLRQGFWLGETEVTQGQWQDVMRTSLAEQRSAALADTTNFVIVGGDKTIREIYRMHFGENYEQVLTSFASGPTYPMTFVSWHEAQRFCERLTAQLRLAGEIPVGWEVVLPSEAQWEYACRAGTEGARYGELDDVAWYKGNSGLKMHVVGGKRANAWGLHDMLGNVFEWTGDWYGGELSGGRDPNGPTKGKFRVSPGGSWLHAASDCRAAYRPANPPGIRLSSVGFRVCLSP